MGRKTCLTTSKITMQQAICWQKLLSASWTLWASWRIGNEEVQSPMEPGGSAGSRWARQSRGAGGGGVVCQLQSVLHVWALPSWHRIPSPCYWLILSILPLGNSPSGPKGGTCTCGPEQPLLPAAGVRLPEHALEQWPGAVVPCGLLACRDQHGAGAGCAEESLSGIANIVRKFCGLRPGLRSARVSGTAPVSLPCASCFQESLSNIL